jgi:hypothetical protein
LHKPAEARVALAKASESLRSKVPDPKSDWSDKWYDLLVAQALMREANALMEGDAKTSAATK